MRYLKTFEQVQDFYGSGTNYHMIVSEDENWYVKSNKNYSAAEMNEDNGYEIFPMSTLFEINIDMTYNFHNAKVALISLNNLAQGDHIAISFENYEKYGKDLNVEKREAEVVTRDEMIGYLVREGYPNASDLLNKSNDEVREIFHTHRRYYKSHVHDAREDAWDDGDPVSHVVIGMKFKSVEFMMGLQKKTKLNI